MRQATPRLPQNTSQREPQMPAGTATISPYCNQFVVQFTRMGSGLQSQPRYFPTEQEARGFCRQHDLQVI